MKRHGIKYLTIPEKEKFLACIKSNPSTFAKRDFFMYSLMLSTGLRLAETVNLNIKDVENKNWLEVLGKGSKLASIPLNACIKEQIKSYLTEESKHRKIIPKAPLFISRFNKRIGRCSVQFRFYHWVKKSELENRYSPHCLRHTVGTELMQKTNNIRLVQEFLRHSSISSTAMYLHPTKEELVNASELLTV